MRALSARQAASCEKACTPRCRCRCHGELHGAARAAAGTSYGPLLELDTELVEYLRQLPQDDPHHVNGRPS